MICIGLTYRWTPEPWFKVKMSPYQYRKSHCGDKTVERSSYLHNGITGKMTSLYWIIPRDSSNGHQSNMLYSKNILAYINTEIRILNNSVQFITFLCSVYRTRMWYTVKKLSFVPSIARECDILWKNFPLFRLSHENVIYCEKLSFVPSIARECDLLWKIFPLFRLSHENVIYCENKHADHWSSWC